MDEQPVYEEVGIQNEDTNDALSSHDVNMVNQLKENQRTLLAANLNLTARFDNLTQAYTDAESKINSLNDENLNLTMQNKELKMEKENLTEQIHNMETTLNELNISRAQWSIDAYCPNNNNARQCQPCQKGWLHHQSSCYAILNPEAAGQKTWEDAREDCRGKISDLVVVDNDAEKNYVNTNSWDSKGTNGYWIGLRAVDEKWKWVNGSDLTDLNSFNQQPATNGQCVISVIDNGWKSVNCTEKNRWICEKKALSV